MGVNIARVFICLRAVVLMLTVSSAAVTSQAAYVYTFSGQIPSNLHPSLGSHRSISTGEAWVATFVINETSPNQGVGSTEGSYLSAVISGELKFSGGYVSPFNFAGFGVGVINTPVNDSIHVAGFSQGRSIVFQAVSNQNPLSSTRLPVPGTNLFASGGLNDGYTQLIYSDRSGGFEYFTNLINNVSFSATVPEPAALAIASLLGASLVVARRRR